MLNRNQNFFEQDPIIKLYFVLRIQKFVLTEVMFLPQIYLQKIKKEHKSSTKQEILYKSIKTNYTRPLSKTVWFMVLTKIRPQEQLPIYYPIKNFRVLVIESIMDINEDLPEWFANIWTKKSRDVTTHKETAIVSEDQQLANEL